MIRTISPSIRELDEGSERADRTRARAEDYEGGGPQVAIGEIARPSAASFTSTIPPVVFLIGHTPLVQLTRVVGDLSTEVYVKLEGGNPGGSIKDRAALFIVTDAMRTGELSPGKTLLDATSGNTGIGYAMLGAALGFPVHLLLPADASPQRINTLRAYGAELTLTDPEIGTEGARRIVAEMARSEPDRFFYADQYNNPSNPRAHYETTGPEIWEQTAGRLTHFVAALGTGGTMTGVGRYLRERAPEVDLIGVQPDRPKNGVDGLKHMATADVPANYDPSLVDREVVVDREGAETMTRRLAQEEGLFVGVSTGAAVAAALRVARELDGGLIVTVAPDGGWKYVGADFWADEDS